MKKFALLMVSMMTAGCANNLWVHPTKNNAQFNQDKNDCIVQSNNAIPRQIVPQQTAQPPTYTTNCYGSNNMASCTTTPKVQPDFTGVAQAIADGSTNRSRENFFSSCMQSRGWALQSAETLATNQAKNQDLAEQYRAAMNNIANQNEQLCADPKYAAYFTKSSCKPTDSSLAELSDNSKVTKQQKEVILKLDAAWNDISKQREEAYASFLIPQALSREAIEFNKSVRNRFQKLRLELYNGKITWGQYNTERKSLSEESGTNFKAIFKKYGG